MKYFGRAFAAFSGVVSLWAGCITIADKYGMQLQGFALWTAENSWWLFPLACFVLGLCIGWLTHKSLLESKTKMNEQARLAEFEKSFKEEKCGDKKALAVCIYEQKDHKVAISDYGVEQLKFVESNFGQEYKYLNFFRYDSRGNDTSYVELDEWLLWLFNKRPYLLKGFPEASLYNASRLLDKYARVVPDDS